MKEIYISSTTDDLLSYREVVYDALRKLNMHVRSMDDYLPVSKPTVERCQDDVTRCDIFIGIIAWRYGSAPGENNPMEKSFTELEYIKAGEEKKTCLLFILDESVPWPPKLMDSFTGENESGKRIRELRDKFQERSASSFKSADHLAMQVVAAISSYLHESITETTQLAFFKEIKEPNPIGSSYLPNIRDKILEARKMQFVEINLETADAWWSTRLHLVAALATDFTSISHLIFTMGDNHFVGMYRTSEVRRRLALTYPAVEILYIQSIERVQREANKDVKIENIIKGFGDHIGSLSPTFQEVDVKELITVEKFEELMQGSEKTEEIELNDTPDIVLRYNIINCHSPFVVLTENKKVKQIVDRLENTTSIAKTILKQYLLSR
jgi:hypothetical protein